MGFESIFENGSVPSGWCWSTSLWAVRSQLSALEHQKPSQESLQNVYSKIKMYACFNCFYMTCISAICSEPVNMVKRKTSSSTHEPSWSEKEVDEVCWSMFQVIQVCWAHWKHALDLLKCRTNLTETECKDMQRWWNMWKHVVMLRLTFFNVLGINYKPYSNGVSKDL